MKTGKMKIAVIGCSGIGEAVARHLIDAGMDMSTVDIIEALNMDETADADLVLREETMLEQIVRTFELAPCLVDLPEISPKRDFQPRF